MKGKMYLAIAALIISTSCATMQSTQMVVQHPKLTFTPSGKNVNAIVTSNTKLFGVFKVAEFEQALKESILKSQLFEVVANSPDYLVRARIVDFKTTSFGLDMDTELEIVYLLIDSGTQETINTERIKTNYTATFGDAFVGTKRSIMSIEGASRKNIQEYIQKLSQIKF